MRLNRVYLDQPLQLNDRIDLPADAVRHLVTVLKMPAGSDIELFNGDGHGYRANLTEVAKKQVTVTITSQQLDDRESALQLHLAQGISRGDKMDLTLQKAVELGVQQITPLFTERCGVKLSAERLQKKQQHWQKVIISACEQCGRNRLPLLNAPIQLNAFIDQQIAAMPSLETLLLLNPHQGQSIRNLKQASQFTLLIGPEGGLSDQEVEHLLQKGATGIQLGPRILRTETAGLAAISSLQVSFGDF